MRLDDRILGRNPGSWLRFLSASGIAIFGYIIGLAVAGMILGAMLEMGFIDFSVWNDFAQGEADTVPGFLLLFSSVAFLHPFLALGIWIAYRRHYLTIANPLNLPWKTHGRTQALYGFLVVIGSMLIVEILVLFVPNWQTPIAVIWQPATWFIWIVPSLLIVLLQCAAEEFFFRGFMQQYLARLVKARWVAMVIPSSLWAILHLGNFEEGAIAWSFVISTFIMGLVLADWADRSRSLTGPIAAHFANNLIVTCLIGNTIESDVMDIWEADFSQISDVMIAVYSIVSVLVMTGFYFWLRPRILRQVPTA